MAENSIIKKKNKFSLIELLMIIMLVGIVFTLIIPLQIDKVNKEKLAEAIRNVQIIARADVNFKENPENGYYIFEHSVLKFDEFAEKDSLKYPGDDLLNIKEKLIKTDGDFLFDYSVTDTTVVAVTNQNFGKEGAKLFYYLPTGPFGLGSDNTSKNVFDPNWLP